METRKYMVLGAAVAAIVACFLPWMVGEGEPLSGFQSALGQPGYWVLVLVGLQVLVSWGKGKWATRVAMLVGAGLLFILFDAFKTALRVEGARPGIGLWLLLAATVTMLASRRWKMANPANF